MSKGVNGWTLASRCGRWGARFLAWTATTLVILALIVWWRVGDGEITADWARPTLIRTLGGLSGASHVDIGGIGLSWDRLTQTPALVAREVTLSGMEDLMGELTLGSVAVSLDRSELLRGRAQPVGIAVEGLDLTVDQSLLTNESDADQDSMAVLASMEGFGLRSSRIRVVDQAGQQVLGLEIESLTLVRDGNLWNLVSEPSLRVQSPALRKDLRLDRLTFAGRYDVSTGEWALERGNIALEGRHIELLGQGGSDGASEVQLDLSLDALSLDQLLAHWPVDEAKGAFDWISENITQASLTNGRINLRSTLDDLSEGTLAAEDVTGGFDLQDVTLHYLRPMPPIESIGAKATFDLGELRFATEGGTLSEGKLAPSNIVIDNLDAPGVTETLDVDASIAIPIPDLLAVIDREPLTLASDAGIEPAATAGSAELNLKVALPLLRDLLWEQVVLDVHGRLDGFSLPDALEGQPLTAGQFELRADPDGLALDGSARVSDIPLNLKVQIVGARTTIEGSGTIQADQLSRLGAPEALPIRGQLGVDFTRIEAGGDQEQSFQVDLTDTAVFVPALKLSKPRGSAGELAFNMVSDDTGLAIRDGRVAWPGVKLTGDAFFAPDGRLRSLELDQLAVSGSDLGVQAKTDGAEGFAVALRGRRLDLTWLTDLFSADAESTTAPVDASGLPPLSLLVNVDELSLGGDLVLADVEARASASKGRLNSFEANAWTEAGGLTIASLSEQAGGWTFELESGDAGGFLQTLGLTEHVNGGSIQVEAAIQPSEVGLAADGALLMEQFMIEDSPSVIRLLSLASIQGIADVFDGRGLYLQKFKAPFTAREGVIRINQAAGTGSELGLTLDGTLDSPDDRLDLEGSLAPLYTLNRFLGQIPLIGNILRGQRQQGAFAITFTIRGPKSDPNVAVNPLALVTPGVIRDAFRALAGNGENQKAATP
ncbi:MAG: DUF3971 domain-containing protein [Geminicoccaceae bacterium]